MTLKPSGVVLAVLWSLIGVALIGGLLTWEPVARLLPYRLVRTVNPHELPPETAERTLNSPTIAKRLADDIDAWLAQRPEWNPDAGFVIDPMPADFQS